jgi:hypothetical protein
VAERELEPGLYEALLTGALDRRLADLVVTAVSPELRTLADAEAADRLSRHIATVVTRAIEALPEQGRAQAGATIIDKLIDLLSHMSEAIDRDVDIPLDPARVLSAILRRKPDGSAEALETPLTPLLDTTLLTNSRGEPAVGHELRAEIHSSDAIDVVMAFVRWSGIRPLLEALSRREVIADRHDDIHEQHRIARPRGVGIARSRDQRLIRHGVYAAARKGLAVSSQERLLNGLHRIVQPDSLGDGQRTRVERPRVWREKPRRRGEDDCRLRVVLGER